MRNLLVAILIVASFQGGMAQEKRSILESDTTRDYRSLESEDRRSLEGEIVVLRQKKRSLEDENAKLREHVSDLEKELINLQSEVNVLNRRLDIWRRLGPERYRFAPKEITEPMREILRNVPFLEDKEERDDRETERNPYKQYTPDWYRWNGDYIDRHQMMPGGA